MRLKFKTTISSLVLTLVIFTTVFITTNFIFLSRDLSHDTAKSLFKAHTLHANSQAEVLFTSGLKLADLAAEVPNPRSILEMGVKSHSVALLVQALKNNSSHYSIYFGFKDGTFVQLIASRSLQSLNESLKAPEQTFWILRTIKNNKAVTSQQIENWEFYSQNLVLLGSRQSQNVDFDPRERPWYEKALTRTTTVLSTPYIFDSLQSTGISASRVAATGNSVIGVDMTMSELQNYISKTAISENGGIVLLDQEYNIHAVSANLPDFKNLDKVLASSLTADDTAADNQKLSKIEIQEQDYLLRSEVFSIGGQNLFIVALAPESDFLKKFEQFFLHIIQMSAIALILFLPVTYFFAGRLTHKVTQLTKQAAKVQDLDFDIEKVENSNIIEFDALIQSFNSMSVSLEKHTLDLKVERERLSKLVELGIALASEKDNDRLLDMILSGAKNLINAEGASVCSLTEDGFIKFEILKNEHLTTYQIDKNTAALKDIKIPLWHGDGSPNLDNVVSTAIHTAESVNIPDAYTQTEYSFSRMKEIDKQNNHQSHSFLTVPLKPRGGNVIGALQLINAKDPVSGEIIAFSSVIQPFVEALAAQAATAMYNKDLLQAQDDLMDSIIQLIAGAIDAKSLYTGGHCERVPQLANMLVEEAEKSTEGELADFKFETKEERREFQIGAWLHDCGKVITPEFVVDKATKLETIYNRIHEIRTRFEVLLRDAKISCLEDIQNGADKKASEQKYDVAADHLREQFAFVANCNIGGEFMTDDQIEKIREIGDQEWVRNFDIKLGLAHQEEQRFTNEPDAPVSVKLLEDKSYHGIPRDRDIKQLYEDYDFKLNIPEYVYNQGELHNLTVQRGTLSEEERFKINEHIMQTIVMLEQLKLPNHLKRVPEYAGTHHETMIGTGYPRQLSADQLSVPSRIMAVADIFEALTASDRPYKKAKTLSEAVKILSFFKKDQHIDPVIFDLFLTSGVYLKYAEKFLSADQIDEVDIEHYIG